MSFGLFAVGLVNINVQIKQAKLQDEVARINAREAAMAAERLRRTRERAKSITFKQDRHGVYQIGEKQ